MEQCSICLESLNGGVVALATCGHRFHAACLAQMAGAVGTATTRRGSLTACPNCRTTSRVAPVTSAAFSIGDRVLALWGHKFYPGVVDEVVDGGQAYEIVWDDGDEGCVLAKNVRAAAPAPATKRKARKKAKYVEGARQQQNGKWTNRAMFPGRVFDDLVEYRAAKKQRGKQRAAYSYQNIRHPCQPPLRRY